jgi:biopolymer transport protein ExbD/biopolymer transport protein TolR
MDLGSKNVKSDINVTPLVDVVLVLLIIFMVITPMLQRGKPVVLPDAKAVSALKQGGDPVLVSITADGKIWIDKAEVPKLEELPDLLRTEMLSHPGAPIMVKADKTVEYKKVRELMLEMSKAGLPGVSLAASQIKEKT